MSPARSKSRLLDHRPIAHDEARSRLAVRSVDLWTSLWTSHDTRIAMGLALILAFPGGAQGIWQATPPHLATQQVGGSLGDFDNEDSAAAEKRLRALNAERHKSLVSDTDKLLKLAHELDDEVNRTNSNSITSAEYSKVATIEKLAHKVKEKMSTSVKGTMDSQPIPFPQRR